MSTLQEALSQVPAGWPSCLRSSAAGRCGETADRARAATSVGGAFGFGSTPAGLAVGFPILIGLYIAVRKAAAIFG